MELEAINRGLFLVLNAPADLSGLSQGLATLAAKGSIYVLAVLLTWTWFAARSRERRALAQLVLAVPLALALNYLIGLALPHPRPFMIGLGHTFLFHRPESSFPSDHASLMWAVAFGMLVWSRARWAGGLAIVLAALTSWARVFLGVHFPFDILGSIGVAILAIFAVRAVGPLRPWIEQMVPLHVVTWCTGVATRIGKRRLCVAGRRWPVSIVLNTLASDQGAPNSAAQVRSTTGDERPPRSDLT